MGKHLERCRTGGIRDIGAHVSYPYTSPRCGRILVPTPFWFQQIDSPETRSWVYRVERCWRCKSSLLRCYRCSTAEANSNHCAVLANSAFLSIYHFLSVDFLSSLLPQECPAETSKGRAAARWGHCQSFVDRPTSMRCLVVSFHVLNATILLILSI